MIRKLMVVGVLIASGAWGCTGRSRTVRRLAVIPMTVGGYFSYFDASYASNKIAGLELFIDYSPFLSGNLGVEGESRWMKYGGSHGFSEYNYLVGPRYRFYYKSEKYQPYAKFLVGAG